MGLNVAEQLVEMNKLASSNRTEIVPGNLYANHTAPIRRSILHGSKCKILAAMIACMIKGCLYVKLFMKLASVKSFLSFHDTR